MHKPDHGKCKVSVYFLADFVNLYFYVAERLTKAEGRVSDVEMVTPMLLIWQAIILLYLHL